MVLLGPHLKKISDECELAPYPMVGYGGPGPGASNIK